MLLGLAAVLLFIPVAAGAVLKLPYYLIAPGEARGVAELINVKGDQAQVFEPKGKILFTTVSLAGNVNVYEALRGWLDDDVQVIDEEQITGGASRQEVRQLNIQAMVDSKLTATKVALERLGYRVAVSGGGALVTLVSPHTPAEGSLQVGDVITAVDGEAVSLHDQVVTKVRQRRPGDPVDIRFRRNGTDHDLRLTTATGAEGQPLIGVQLQTNDLRYDFPVDVNIETGLVGGPSAGLAFTLALIDDLSPGELTGGRSVAVTGTMDADGRVGMVGGVAQKTVTARRAGAAAFLVPPQEAKEARAHAGKMRIIPVSTLDEALVALEQLGGSGVALPTGAAPQPS
jgi:PDZ domain-containing protein